MRDEGNRLKKQRKMPGWFSSSLAQAIFDKRHGKI
jgi:hypothetical protein